MRRIRYGLTVLATAALLTACAGTPTAAATTAAGANGGQATPATAAAKLNLNTATADDFLTVPGVGNRMVREFLEYRPYVSIEQFRREIGKYVSDAEVAAYEQYVFVPVDINAADAATLMQLPGVNETIAADLIAGRPFASTADFLTSLASQVTAEQAAQAEAYLAE